MAALVDLDALFSAANSSGPVECVILEIQRQLVTVDLRVRLAYDAQQQYAYDVTVCGNTKDGVCKAVALLHPQLNALLETGILRRGRRIAVYALTRAPNPSRDSAKSVPVVVQLQPLDCVPNNDELCDEVPWHPQAITDGRPSVSTSLHYLPTFNDDFMASISTWSSARKHIPRGRLLSKPPAAEAVFPAGVTHLYVGPRLPTIEQRLTLGAQTGRERHPAKRSRDRLEADGKDVMSFTGGADDDANDAAAASASSLPRADLLVGRLAAVGKILHWGKVDSNVKVPFKATFRIVDNTRYVECVLWNTTAAYFHEALTELPLGTLLAVQGFRLKVYEGKMEADFNVGTKIPAQIYQLDDAELGPSLPLSRFPSPSLRFMKPKAVIEQSAHGSALSLVGIVARVGPFMREYSGDTYTGPGGATGSSGTTAASSSSSAAASGSTAASEADALLVSSLKTALSGSVALAPSPGRGPWSCFRWVWIRSNDSNFDIAVKLYLNSRPSIFELTPGVPIVLTHLRCEAPITAPLDSPASRPVYLSSTDLTSSYLGADAAAVSDQPVPLRAMSAWSPEVAELLNWRASSLADGVWWSRVNGGTGNALEHLPDWGATISSLTRPRSLADYQLFYFPPRAQPSGGGGLEAPFSRLNPAQLQRLISGNERFVSEVKSAAAAVASAAASTSHPPGGGGGAAAASPASDSRGGAVLGEPLPDRGQDIMSGSNGDGGHASTGIPVMSVAALASRHVTLQLLQFARIILIGKIMRVDQAVFTQPPPPQQQQQGDDTANSSSGSSSSSRGDASTRYKKSSKGRALKQRKKAIREASVSRSRALDTEAAAAAESSAAETSAASSSDETSSASDRRKGRAAAKAAPRGRTVSAAPSRGLRDRGAKLELNRLSSWLPLRPRGFSRRRGRTNDASSKQQEAQARSKSVPLSKPAKTSAAAPPSKTRKGGATSISAAAPSKSRTDGSTSTRAARASSDEEDDEPIVVEVEVAQEQQQQQQRVEEAEGEEPWETRMGRILVNQMGEEWYGAADHDGFPGSSPSSPFPVLTVSDCSDDSSIIVLPLRTSGLLPHFPPLPLSLAPSPNGYAAAADASQSTGDGTLPAGEGSQSSEQSVVKAEPKEGRRRVTRSAAAASTTMAVEGEGKVAHTHAGNSIDSSNGAAAASLAEPPPSTEEPVTADAELDHVRSFFPASAPRERFAFIRYLMNRRCAFCVTVHQRSHDNLVNRSTGAWMTPEEVNELPSDELEKRRSTRRATLRVEAVYDLEEEEGAAAAAAAEENGVDGVDGDADVAAAAE